MKFKAILRVNLVTLLVGISLVLYSILCYKYALERVIMPDLSFHLFKIVAEGNFAIQNNRFGAIFTQILPLLAFRENLSLEKILELYSLSFPFLYITVFILLTKMKVEKYVIILFFYLFSITAHSFFWPISEIHQGIVWLILFLAYAEYYNFSIENKKLIILGLILIPIIVFLYPLMIITLGFSIFYLYRVLSYRSFLKLVSAYTCVLFLLKIFIFSNRYDNESIVRIFNLQHFLNVFYLKSTHNFIGQMFANYYVWFCGFIAVILVNIYTKRTYVNFLLIVTTISLILMINVSYMKGGEAFYLEGQYMQISFFLGLVIGHEYWHRIPQLLKYFIITIVFLFFLGRVVSLSKQYSARIRFYEKIINEYVSKKRIIVETTDMVTILKMSWGSSYETWLLSTLKSGRTSSILITNQPDRFMPSLNKENVWITEWETIDYEKLNPRYFVFRDSGNYIVK